MICVCHGFPAAPGGQAGPRRQSITPEPAGRENSTLSTVPLPPSSTAPQPGPGAAPHHEDLEPHKEVPVSRDDRQRVRARAAELAACLEKSRPLARHAVEAHARSILAELGLPEGFLGWTMVAVASAFWREHIEAVPHRRRLLLLPHCLRKAETCPAKFDQLGLLCEDCGACRLSDLRTEAERLGYTVLIAEGSPVVLQMILRGEADAILGAACLNSLEKAFEKVLQAGVPCMAVPLLTNSCRNTTTDVDWVREMIATPFRPGARIAQTYVHLLRAAAGMFEPDELDRLLPPRRRGEPPTGSNGRGGDGPEPAAATASIARDFLLQGGKHLRPFITLAAYDAMTGGRCAGPAGPEHAAAIPDPVRRVALAIEVFHKASLVHDDIEDDDAFRYGQPALHRRHGAAAAINVGDYLIGLGYRLVAEQRAALGAEVVAEVLARLAEAHTRLCEGQGAELAWRDGGDRRLAPLDAMRIYALKTAPAFEAALGSGIRLAAPAEDLREPVARFSRYLGVAFQMLNDLDDWRDSPNKRAAGTDVLGGRPTVLWALALENLSAAGRRELERLAADPADGSARLARIREVYGEAGVFDQVAALIRKQRERAHAVADAVAVEPLGRLLHYLADSILEP
jgi:geranylgeranyl pyrophosphate synthase